MTSQARKKKGWNPAMIKIHIFTDGSSRGNPGPGGWAAIVMNEEEDTIITMEYDTEEYVTNNQMELKALLFALQYAEERPKERIVIFSDSAYVVNAYNDWIRKWARSNWKTSKGQPVENLAVMQELYTYITRPFFNATVQKCSGHTGEIGNELADAVATGNWKKYNDLIEFWNIKVPEQNGDNWFPND